MDRRSRPGTVVSRSGLRKTGGRLHEPQHDVHDLEPAPHGVHASRTRAGFRSTGSSVPLETPDAASTIQIPGTARFKDLARRRRPLEPRVLTRYGVCGPIGNARSLRPLWLAIASGSARIALLQVHRGYEASPSRDAFASVCPRQGIGLCDTIRDAHLAWHGWNKYTPPQFRRQFIRIPTKTSTAINPS